MTTASDLLIVQMFDLQKKHITILQDHIDLLAQRVSALEQDHVERLQEKINQLKP